jgi:hypothetical protein
MKHTFVKFTTVLTLCSLLASCANIKNDQARTTAEGGLGGAVLGGVAGYLIGGSRGALIGGLAGGAGGLAYGAHVAAKKKAYKSTEAWLNACIDQAEKTNSRARSYNASLSSKISRLEQQINDAKSKGDKGELKNLKRAVLTLQNEAKRERATLENEIKNQNTAVNQGGSSATAVTLRTKVGELRSTQSAISQNETKLADLGRRIDV